MKVVSSPQSSRLTFKDLTNGQVFQYEGGVYMRVASGWNNPKLVNTVNAVGVINGILYLFQDGYEVTLLPNAALHLNEGVS
jgi:hypothetical protein